jgi:hypothetical protein
MYNFCLYWGAKESLRAERQRKARQQICIWVFETQSGRGRKWSADDRLVVNDSIKGFFFQVLSFDNDDKLETAGEQWPPPRPCSMLMSKPSTLIHNIRWS